MRVGAVTFVSMHHDHACVQVSLVVANPYVERVYLPLNVPSYRHVATRRMTSNVHVATRNRNGEWFEDLTASCRNADLWTSSALYVPCLLELSICSRHFGLISCRIYEYTDTIYNLTYTRTLQSAHAIASGLRISQPRVATPISGLPLRCTFLVPSSSASVLITSDWYLS